MEITYKYKAFISYSHQDKKFARWLHKKIENYKIPKLLRKKYLNLPKDLKRTVFIDDEELPTASALPDNLSHALESSELLIVVCSPSATQSYWVDKEIAYFKQYHGEGKVLAVLKEGEPNATYSSVYDNNQEAFPKSLRYTVNKNAELTEERTEPLAADARKRTNRKKALMKLIAGILKVDFADLWKREKRETRKRRVIYGSLLAVFIAVSIYASIQFAGEQGNKELERISNRINTIEYSIRHDELPVEKVIALNKELKKLKVDKENKEVSQEALGKLKTSLGKKAQKVYQKEGAKPAIEVLTSKSALANQESRLKDISKEKLTLAKLYVETYEFEKAKESYEQAIALFFDYENAYEYERFLSDQKYYRQSINIFEKLLKERKLLRYQRAHVLHKIAISYDGIKGFKEAEEAYNKALKIYRALVQKDPDTYNYDLVSTLQGKAFLYMYLNRLKEAEKTFNEVLKINRALAQKNPGRYSHDLASTLSNMASAYELLNKPKEAEEAYSEALKINMILAQKNPDVYNYDLATTLRSVAIFYMDNKPKKAEEAYSEALKIIRALVKINPDAYNQDLAISLPPMASMYNLTGRHQKAEEVYREALTLYRGLAQKNPHRYNHDLAMTLRSVATFYVDLNKAKEAEKIYIEALKIIRVLAQKNPAMYNQELAKTLRYVAKFYINLNKQKEAEELFNEALKLNRSLAQIDPGAYVSDLESVLSDMAHFYMNLNKPKEAEELYNEALKINRELVHKNSNKFSFGQLRLNLLGIASLYARTNRFLEAEETYNEVLKTDRIMVQKNPATNNWNLAGTLITVARFYVSLNKQKEAEKLYNEALKINRELVHKNSNKFSTGQLRLNLLGIASLYAGTNRFLEAEEVYSEVLKTDRTMVQKNPAIYNQDLAQTLGSMIEIYLKTNKFKKAEEVHSEALKLYRDLANENLQAYGIPYAALLIMKGDSDKENLVEAQTILRFIKGNPIADQLLTKINNALKAPISNNPAI